MGNSIPFHASRVEDAEVRVSMAGRGGRAVGKWSLPMTSEAGGEFSLEADPGRKNLWGGLGTVALRAAVNSNHPNFQREWTVPEQAPRQNGTFPFYCVCRKREMD